MAITVSLTPSQVTLSTTGGASTFTLTDNSTYGSPARNTVGVFVTTHKVDFQGNRSPLTISSNNSTPTTDSLWTSIFSADGWHQALYVALPNYNGGTIYALYDAVYDTSGLKGYISNSAGNVGHALSNTTYWTQLSDPTVLCLNVGLSNQSNNITAAILNFTLYPLIKQQFGIQTGIAFLEQSTDSKRTKDVLKYHLYALAVNAINQADIALDYELVEILARRASTIT